MLEEAERTHWNVLKQTAGIEVNYNRGGEGIRLTVVPGHGGNDSLQFAGRPMEDSAKSFLIGINDLHNFFPPRKDDVIMCRKTGKTWKVKPDTLGATFTESGNYGVMIRVHVIEG